MEKEEKKEIKLNLSFVGICHHQLVEKFWKRGEKEILIVNEEREKKLKFLLYITVARD